MTGTTYIEFRGEKDVKVSYEIIADESDTNAWECHYTIVDDRFPDVEPTSEEDLVITLRLSEIEQDRDWYGEGPEGW